MRAKPIIDILVGIVPYEDWIACKAPLERLGCDYAANAGVPEHHIFGRKRNTAERTHLVHVVGMLTGILTQRAAEDLEIRGDNSQKNRPLRLLLVATTAMHLRPSAPIH
jgi:GrpB-like predicted nucleotidyltransferase (UPF0157 family)